VPARLPLNPGAVEDVFSRILRIACRPVRGAFHILGRDPTPSESSESRIIEFELRFTTRRCCDLRPQQCREVDLCSNFGRDDLAAWRYFYAAWYSTSRPLRATQITLSGSFNNLGRHFLFRSPVPRPR
jgi:hypothetical protein